MKNWFVKYIFILLLILLFRDVVFQKNKRKLILMINIIKLNKKSENEKK